MEPRITMTLTSRQVAACSTSLQRVADLIGPCLEAEELRDISDYMMDVDNWLAVAE